MKKYSKLELIPTGRAKENLIDACLVLEGGAFRGLYTQGFLDAMMMNDLNLSCVIGVSAGALGGLNYSAGHIGRSARINLEFRHDPEYVGVKAFLKSKSFLNVRFVTEDNSKLEPFDYERLMRPDSRFVAVATNCLTGKPAYMEKGKCPDIMLAARASATMPYISKMVYVKGVPYLDGGCSDKIPFQWAINEGYEKIVVIRTRNKEYRKKNKESKIAKNYYKNYPEFAEVLAVSDLMYNQQCEEVQALADKGRLRCYGPEGPVEVSRVEGDMEKLGDLYFQGYRDCIKHLDELKGYLE